MSAIHGHFTGIGGAIVVGLIAFSACFLVLGGLALIIYGIKYMAKVGERRDGQGTAPAKQQQPTQPAQASSAAVARAVAQPPAGTAPAGGAQETIAAITGAVLAARGGKAFSIRTVTQVGAGLRSGNGRDRRGAWETAGLLENLGELERTWNAPA